MLLKLYLNDVVAHRTGEAAVLSRRLFSFNPLFLRFLEDVANVLRQLTLKEQQQYAVTCNIQSLYAVCVFGYRTFNYTLIYLSVYKISVAAKVTPVTAAAQVTWSLLRN